MRNPILPPSQVLLARDPDVAEAVRAYRANRNPRTLHQAQSALARKGVANRDRKRVLKALVRILGPNYGEEGYS